MVLFRLLAWSVLLALLKVPLFASATDALALQNRLIQVFDQNKHAIVRVKAAYRQTVESEALKEGQKEEKKEDNKTITSAINFYERECVRMLVNYGTTDFEVIGLDRKSFIDYFLNEIEDVEFENKNYLEIIEVFKREFKKDKIIDINYFFNRFTCFIYAIN